VDHEKRGSLYVTVTLLESVIAKGVLLVRVSVCPSVRLTITLVCHA